MIVNDTERLWELKKEQGVLEMTQGLIKGPSHKSLTVILVP